MAVYGGDLYGKGLYGAALPIAFSAGPMVCDQWDYGALHITWNTPQQTTTSPTAGFKGFTQLRLVRSPYGIPADENDGLVLVNEPSTTGTTSYVDTTGVPGRFYYYAVFVAAPNDPYQPSYTYGPGDLVSYGGASYIALQTATGQQPDTSPTYWAASTATTPWVRAAACVGLVVADHGNSGRLVDLVPRPYRVREVETTGSDPSANTQLEKFLALFGFHLDVIATENDALLGLNDVASMTDAQLWRRAYDLGLQDELPTLPHLRRRFVEEAPSLADRRGTAAGLADLVGALTGWDADVATGYNMMLNEDQAQFQAPVYPVWDAATPYQVGDYATQNNFLYQAATYPSVRINAATLTAPSPSSGGTVVLQSNAALAYGSHYLMSSSTQGQYMDVTFSVGTAATYDVSFASLMGPDYAQVTLTLNGSPIPGVTWPIDFYSATVRESSPIYLGQLPLLSGANVLRFTATSKNPVSKGYKMSADYWIYNTVGALAVGHPPTGTATSNTYWTYLSPGTASLQATSPELNALTGGQSTWYTTAASPVTAAQSAQAIALAGAATARSSEGLRNCLRVTTAGSGTGDLTLESVGPAASTTWSASTAYVPGAMVTYNGTNYKALVPTLGDQPDASPTRWGRTQLTTSASPDPQMVQTYGIPLPVVPAWSSSGSYAIGDQVTLQGNVYAASLPVPIGQRPTGYASDNPWWRWTGRDVPIYTFSMSQYRTATAAGQYVRGMIDWFDEYGNFLASSQTSDTPFFLTRFETDQTYPRSTGSAPTGTVTAAAQQTGVPIPWNTSVGDWTTADGVAYPTSWYDDSTQSRKAGRVLWFNRAWVNALTTGDTVYATFISAPSDPTYEQGVVFRYGGGTYLMASRTRLTKMVYTTSSGLVTGTTLTVLGTYSGGFTFANGQRIRVVATPTNVSVYNVTGQGPALDTLLLTVANTDNVGQYGFGLLERSP